MKPIIISDVDSDENLIPVEFPGGKVVKIIRLDYLDEETADAMQSDLEALDVEQQLVAVANDIASAKVGERLKWQPLLDDTKAKLVAVGVEVSRVVDADGRYDEVRAPSAAVLDALMPYSEQKTLSVRKRGREVALTMLKHVVAEDELPLFEALVLGQLNSLLGEWRKNSSATQGE